MDNVSLIVDTLDEITLLYYNEFGGKYLDILTKVIKHYVENLPLGFESETEEQRVYDLYEVLSAKTICFSEWRQAFLLLEVKGYKHANIGLDSITPDSVGVIISELIKVLTADRIKKMIDVGIGSGNLTWVVAENTDSTKWDYFGVEIASSLSYYLEQKAQISNLDVTIFNQDALSLGYQGFDLMIGDLQGYELEESQIASTWFRYYPYQLLTHCLQSVGDECLMLFIVDSDFFSQPEASDFQSKFKKHGHIIALIALPETLFIGSPRYLLIASSNNDSHKGTDLFILPNINNQAKFLEVINQIKHKLEEIVYA